MIIFLHASVVAPIAELALIHLHKEGTRKVKTSSDAKISKGNNLSVPLKISMKDVGRVLRCGRSKTNH